MLNMLACSCVHDKQAKHMLRRNTCPAAFPAIERSPLGIAHIGIASAIEGSLSDFALEPLNLCKNGQARIGFMPSCKNARRRVTNLPHANRLV